MRRALDRQQRWFDQHGVEEAYRAPPLPPEKLRMAKATLPRTKSQV